MYHHYHVSDAKVQYHVGNNDNDALLIYILNSKYY